MRGFGSLVIQTFHQGKRDICWWYLSSLTHFPQSTYLQGVFHCVYFSYPRCILQGWYHSRLYAFWRTWYVLKLPPGVTKYAWSGLTFVVTTNLYSVSYWHLPFNRHSCIFLKLQGYIVSTISFVNFIFL